VSDAYNPDHLRDALDHIMRVARCSRSGSTRDNWIAYRAYCALTGRDDWDAEKIPRMTMLRQNSELRDALKLCVDALEFAHGGEPLPTMELESITKGKAILDKLERA
jgi:hypothetical protein